MKIICTTINAKFIHTNLAIRYLKAYAQPEFNVEITEYTIKDPLMNIVTDLYRKKPNVIGFSCYIWNMEETIKVIKLLKKINSAIKIVLGGPEVSYDAKDWMNKVDEIDFIVSGEGEETFKRLLQELEGDQKFEQVGGMCYRNSFGEPKMIPQINKLDLRSIPTPFRFAEDISSVSKRIAYIETSRGCPFNCQFCLSSVEIGVRYFDREFIKEEIRYLMKNGAKTFKFLDRTFNISRSYAMDIFQFLIDEHLPGTVFQFEITADIMRPEVIEFLNKEAPPGLFRFEIGVQSTNDYTNELVKRKQNFEKLTRTVTMVKNGGKIDQHLDLIAGLPEEDYTSFRKTFNDVFAMRPEELQLGFLKMLRGTGLRKQADEYQYVYMDQAPYEILSNRVLPFDDVIRIKQVEDVLEKYWNDHRMDHSIEYIVKNSFSSPFDFFQEFGSYWEKRGWSRIGHQLEDLFKRLDEFLDYSSVKDIEMIRDLMKYDYLSHQKYKPRKPWWKPALTKQERSRYYQAIAKTPKILTDMALNEKDIMKHTVLEPISFSISQYLMDGTIINTPMLLFVYFNSATEKPVLLNLETSTLRWDH
nr:B12-binding domain-containing radical SAM protein [uncultured Bacillus sp.]